jgi:anti-sigma B factor antagonist
LLCNQERDAVGVVGYAPGPTAVDKPKLSRHGAPLAHSPPPPFRVRVERSDPSAPIVAVEGELDVATSGELACTLRRELKGASRVRLDLSHVDFIDSTGLAAIVKPLREAPGERRIELTGTLPSQARRLLELTGLLQLLRGEESPGR